MATEVDFVRRFALERHVRTVLVIPIEEQLRFLDHYRSRNRNENAASATVLEGQDHPLGHGNASVLANGAEALFDFVRLAPRLKLGGDELRTLIGDEVLRFHAVRLANPAHDRLDLGRCRILFENLEAHDAAREMIDHDEKRLTVDFRLSPVLVIIFHHGEAAFTGPIDVAGVYDDYGFMDDFVPHRRALLFDLNTLREDEIPDDPETPELFAVLRIMQVIFSTDIGTKSRIVLERLKPYSEIPKYRRLIRFLWFYLVSSERHLARRELMAVTKTVKKVIGEKNMPTILEQLRAEGKAEGLAEAETKALVEKAETLLTVIRARFKNMSKTAEDKVRKVKDKVVLDLLVAHAATCESLGDFEKHLRFDKKRIHDSQMSTHLELTAWWFVLSTNTTTFWDFWIISSKNMRKFPAYKNGLATKQLKTSLRRSKK